MVEYTSFPFAKVITGKEVHEIERDPLVKKSIQALLTSTYVDKAFPSHNFGHAYTTALTATQKAVEAGVTDKKVLRNIFLSGIYHDSYREMRKISGAESVDKAAKFTEERLKSIMEKEDIEQIQQAIKGKNEIAKYLNYADALEFAPIRAIYMGRVEMTKYNPVMMEMPSEAGLAVYNGIYEEKMKQLPHEMRKEIENHAER